MLRRPSLTGGADPARAIPLPPGLVVGNACWRGWLLAAPVGAVCASPPRNPNWPRFDSEISMATGSSRSPASKGLGSNTWGEDGRAGWFPSPSWERTSRLPRARRFDRLPHLSQL